MSVHLHQMKKSLLSSGSDYSPLITTLSSQARDIWKCSSIATSTQINMWNISVDADYLSECVVLDGILYTRHRWQCVVVASLPLTRELKYRGLTSLWLSPPSTFKTNLSSLPFTSHVSLLWFIWLTWSKFTAIFKLCELQQEPRRF